MKVLITGGAGFVGRHLHSELAKAGHQVTNIDLAYGQNAMDFFTDIDPGPHFDAVFHCAAIVKGRAGIDGMPAKLHAYNTMLDAAMWNWTLEMEPRHVVYYSSSAAYGVQDQLDGAEWRLAEEFIDLQEPLVPEASYGMVKLHGEQIAADIAQHSDKTTITVFRPFSGYGHDQDLDYPFPSFIARAKAKADPFDVWGDGTQQRDWVHIDDIVSVSILAAEERIHDTLNICTGRGTTFTELAAMTTSKAGYSPEIRYRFDAPAGVAYRVGDPTNLERYYKPLVSIEEGVDRALAEA